jgi:ABC-type polysaccharide/polyol phosphate transport system ATPase subunit
VGQNGAGKSTTLSLIAGLSWPERGSVSVSGRIAALLELGSGFHHDLTGMENIKLNASLLGFSRKQTLGMIDEIIEFSGVGDFIHEPIRTYSTGMVMRLAFSVAVNLNPDILITDEILTVGDAAFQEKCLSRIRQFTEAGKTIVSVSHDPGMVKMLCDRAIWLDHGHLIQDGKASEVLQAYADRFAVSV